MAVQLFGAGKSRMSYVGDQGVAETGDRGWPLGVQLFGRDDLICVQQFLVKGLLKVDTELCTIEVWHASICKPLNTPDLHLAVASCRSITIVLAESLSGSSRYVRMT